MPPYAATYVFGFEGIKILKKMFNFNSNAQAIISRRACALRCLSSPWAAQREAINAALASVYAMLMNDYLPIQASATSIIVSTFRVRFCAQEYAEFKRQNGQSFAIFQCRRASNQNIHTKPDFTQCTSLVTASEGSNMHWSWQFPLSSIPTWPWLQAHIHFITCTAPMTISPSRHDRSVGVRACFAEPS